MKQIGIILIGILLVGGGCTEQKNQTRHDEWESVTGVNLLLKAKPQNGSPVVVHRPSINRRFRAQIGPTFEDRNGSYPMTDGATIELQLGVLGTPEEDREQLKQLDRLSLFDEGTFEGWHVTAAYDEAEQRWTLRAAQADPGLGESGYHVIECLATSTSDFVFWDGCRTFIESAQILESN